MRGFISLAVLGAALPLAAFGQWSKYPTAGVPKANGKPNLNAKTPRTAQGKPDFTGIWENTLPPRFPEFGEARPAPNPGAPTGLDLFRDVNAAFNDGLPLTPWAADVKKKRMADFSKDNPDAHCLPMGNMQFDTHPQPRKIVQTPGLIVILYEANAGVRQIFLDGRPAPKKDADPWWYGYSTGKWEGDTLVVETTGFREDVWLDINGSPLTESGKMIEKFRRPNFGTLEMEITVEDPKAYTRPWTIKLTQHIALLDSEMIEFICAENEKDTRHMVGK